MLNTRFTERFALSAPIASAPMALAAGGAMAAAVTQAGGLGFIGGGYGDLAWIEAQFKHAGNTRVGCGLITWKLAQNPAVVDAVLAHKPAAVFLSFGDIGPFAAKARAAEIPVFAQVQTLAMAHQAADAGADVLVAQGTEAGGHGATRGTLSLVPEVVDALSERCLILAAGGIADGRGLAAALALGADGVVMGSRFWASTEALVPAGLHTAALQANGDETTRGSLPDIARGLDWPRPFTIRTLRNAWIRSHETRGTRPDTTGARAQYAQAVQAGDASIAPAIVGEGTGLIREVLPAGEILAKTVAQAEAALSKFSGQRLK